MTEFIVVGMLNTGKNYIYTLKSDTTIAKFKFINKKWKFLQKVDLSETDLDKAYSLEVLDSEQKI